MKHRAPRLKADTRTVTPQRSVIISLPESSSRLPSEYSEHNRYLLPHHHWPLVIVSLSLLALHWNDRFLSRRPQCVLKKCCCNRSHLFDSLQRVSDQDAMLYLLHRDIAVVRCWIWRFIYFWRTSEMLSFSLRKGFYQNKEVDENAIFVNWFKKCDKSHLRARTAFVECMVSPRALILKKNTIVN